MTDIRLLKNGSEAFPAMFEAIDRASARVSLEMYIFGDDHTGREFRARLIAAAKRGIEVRALIDAWGSWLLPDSFWDDLRAAGGIVRWFRPVSKALFLFRNHRKLLLVDDRTAYIGGLNVTDDYYLGAGGRLPWRDNVLEVSGPEVASLRRSFSRMCVRAKLPFSRVIMHMRRRRKKVNAPEGGLRFLESGPENPVQPVRRAYRQVIHNAVLSIDLAMGYFYPTGRIMRELKRAVKRGVHVRLLVPRHSDVAIARWAARGLYGRILRAGIEVWEYLPTMLHSKLAIADDTVIAGSANLDIRSGRINHELVIAVTDPVLAQEARSDFDEDIAHSERVIYDDWKKRPFIQKLKERLSYILLARADLFIARSGIARTMW